MCAVVLAELATAERNVLPLNRYKKHYEVEAGFNICTGAHKKTITT